MQFFETEVISRPEIQKWIQKQYSISFLIKTGNFLRHKPWKAPDVWMLTGIQLIKGGSVEEGASKNTKMSGSTDIDPGMVHGVKTGMDVSIHGSHGYTEIINASYYHKDERVWAAQFMQLDLEFKKIARLELLAEQLAMPPTTAAKMRMSVTVKDVVHLDENALRKSKDDDDDSDAENDLVEYDAHIFGLKRPDVAISEQTPNSKLAEIEFTGVEFSLDKFLEAAQGIDWEEYEKYSKYWDDLETWEEAEAGR